MKLINYFISSGLIATILFSSTTIPLTSCEKVIHDTTTITIRDTIVLTDTACSLELGLVAYYNFNNSSLKDLSGKGNDIVFNNATPTVGRNGVPNSAFLFNGQSSYMKILNSPSLNPNKITLMATIKVNGFFEGTCHANQIVGKGYPDQINGYYSLRFLDANSDCYGPVNVNTEFFSGAYGDYLTGNVAGANADTSFVQTARWYTVIYTYDGNESRIYVDGNLKNVVQKAARFTPNTQDVFIGRHENPAFPYWFNGVIDEVRIYDRALCSCEISKLSYTKAVQ
ncbi:MAG: LamG domain-containing protein [Chitinophagaceae bacterium]|nr:LamG domain-containing protein [Chitinophagaceae bacterium]